MKRLMFGKVVVLLLIFTLFENGRSIAQDQTRILNLRGKWKFSIGDNKEWKQENFNDKDWEEINAPSPWEDQGFYGYDGFAWYRKTFVIPAEYADKDLYLYLGDIDDCDETYVNGTLVGFSGSMPPKFSTAYNSFRKYFLPKEILKYGKPNVISVRVYDAQLAGGITDGDLGIYADLNPMPLEINLQGLWKFKPGDNPDYLIPQFNDSKWKSISVPKNWEDQGYPNLDGFAWYRKTFLVTSNYSNERMVVVMGKVDDLDEVYLNGQFIGRKKIEEYNQGETVYGQLRVYYIDGKLLQQNKYNVIAVRILDEGGLGGIYEGPIGIVKQKDFVRYWRSKK